MKSINQRIEKLTDAVEQLQKEHRHELDDFIVFLRKPYDELSIVLKAHMFGKDSINRFFEVSMVKPSKLKNRNYYFIDKVNILYAIGYINDTIYEKLDILNWIRGKFAHDYKYKLTQKDLENWDKGKAHRSETIKERLIHEIVFITGYLCAMKDFEIIIPFYNACYHRNKIFKKDLGYNITEILKNYPDEIFDKFRLKDD